MYIIKLAHHIVTNELEDEGPTEWQSFQVRFENESYRGFGPRDGNTAIRSVITVSGITRIFLNFREDRGLNM